MAVSRPLPVLRGDQHQFDRLRGAVLVHLGDNAQAPTFASHADGVVLHGNAGSRVAGTLGPESMVVLDAERYTSDRGSTATAQLFPESVQESVQTQAALGVACYLAPSRFPIDRTPRTLRSLLATGREFVDAVHEHDPGMPAFVPIVVRFDELADRRWIEPVVESGVPIATVFAGHGDPLATADQLQGAIELVRCARSAMVLRCDMAAAGFMSIGAVTAAIGASSAVRHLWLPSRSRNQKSPSRSVFVPSANSWMKTRFVEQAAADPELDAVFGCSCDVCGLRGDVRNLVLPGVSAEIQDRHSVAASVAAARSVLAAASPLAEWRSVCEAASETYSTIERFGISGPTRPAAIQAWLSVLP
jgi:hypothetical protein